MQYVKAMWMMNALLMVRVQGVPQGEERVTVVARHRKEVVLQSVRDRQLSHGLSRLQVMMALLEYSGVHLRPAVAGVLCAPMVTAGARLVWMMRCL